MFLTHVAYALTALLALGIIVVGVRFVLMAVIPIGDAAIVLRRGRSKLIAYGVHGATAALMLAVAGLLLI